jgi:hypothetical protein
MRRRLVRSVAALDFLEGTPPRYLYSSGRPGRCNPRDVNCLYFSETERVADVEYRGRFAGVGPSSEPRLIFVAQVDLRHVVDLSRPAVLKALGISIDDVLEPWRTAPVPTHLQQLGLAVSGQRRVAAIRFASDTCRRAGTKGWNVAIFPDAIVAPNRVRILGKSGASLEELR